jgi:hypothetical protein
MKSQRVPLFYSAVVAGAICPHAAVFSTFTGLDPGASTVSPMSLAVSFKPDSLFFTATWALTEGWIQPSSGTPRVVESPPGSGTYVANQVTYTITIANVVAKVWSTESLITGIASGAAPGYTSVVGEPTYVSLGPFQYEVTLTMPSGPQGSDYPQIAFSSSSTTAVVGTKEVVFDLNTIHSLSTSGFSVSFYSESDPDGQGVETTSPFAGGGKGIASASIPHQLGGVVAVPETPASVLLAGLGLAAFAARRRWERHTAATGGASAPARPGCRGPVDMPAAPDVGGGSQVRPR